MKKRCIILSYRLDIENMITNKATNNTEKEVDDDNSFDSRGISRKIERASYKDEK